MAWCKIKPLQHSENSVGEGRGKDEPPAARVFMDVISHVGCRPRMRSLGPLARQISSLLSARVNNSPQMLARCGQLCVCVLDACLCARDVCAFGESLSLCMGSCVCV